MGNRKQPFGYKMALGEIVIQESEAKLEIAVTLKGGIEICQKIMY